MKKIKLFLIASLVVGSLNAQNNSNASINPASKMSVDEANRLNGKAEPTYQGGKTYSQWVAEQKALQKEQSIKSSALYTTSNSGLINAPAPTKTVAPAEKRGNEGGTDTKPAANVIAKEEVKTVQAPVLHDFAAKNPYNTVDGKKPAEEKAASKNNGAEGAGDMKTRQAEASKVIAKGTEKPVQSLPAPGPAPIPTTRGEGGSNTGNN